MINSLYFIKKLEVIIYEAYKIFLSTHPITCGLPRSELAHFCFT